MTLLRVIALSLLLGSAVAGIVWFSWGAIANAATRNRRTGPAQQDAAGPPIPKNLPVPAASKRNSA